MPADPIAGRYRMIEPLGRGAMSAVWLAEDEDLRRRVAVKVLAPTADRARFEREARAAASLSHPNICALYDYGEAEDKPFMVLEYLPNGSLEDRLRDAKPLPDDETRRIAGEVAAGLAHAHERGLVHRDLKPANVLFDVEDRAKIADFGIARMGGAGTLTEAGTVLGTASYISPEQADGRPAAAPSDVYSFGVILFRMLTGRLPFVADSAMELVRMHRDEPPPTVAEFRPDAPQRLAHLADAALAKAPGSRPADGAALLAELGGATGMEPATLPKAPAAAVGGDLAATRVLPPPVRASRRLSAPVPIVAALLVLLGAGIAVALIATQGGSNGSPGPGLGLSLPSVPTAFSSTTPSTSTAAATTVSASTTTPTLPATTTAPRTTHTTTTSPTTTSPPATTGQVTTVTTPSTTTATTTAATGPAGATGP